MEHIAYAQAFSGEEGLTIQRIGPQGVETIRPKEFPVLVTATACTEPLYRSFHKAREANKKPILEWNAEAVGAEEERIGMKGSKTRVFRIFSPSEDRDKECIYPEQMEDLVAQLSESYEKGPAEETAQTDSAYSLDGKEASYQGEVWVFAEQEGGIVNPVSLELISKARELADCLNEKVGAVLVGHEVEKLTPGLIGERGRHRLPGRGSPTEKFPTDSL